MLCYTTSASAAPEGGITQWELEDGRLRKVSFTPCAFAGYLAWSQDRATLYAAIGAGGSQGGLAAFHVNADGSLTLRNECVEPGLSLCHLCLSPDGAFLYAADYHRGQLLEFELRVDGGLAGIRQRLRHTGHGPHPTRQEGPHVHCTAFAPDGRFLCAVDLGTDSLYAYPYTAHGIEDHPAVTQLPPGVGPRHLLFAPDLGKVYLINELANSVMTLKYSDGHFEILQALPTLPPTVEVFSKASALRRSPDGRWLLASNRGYDTIAIYRIGADGMLKPAGETFCGARSLRDINFVEGTETLLAGGEASNDLYGFELNAGNGTLLPDGICIPKLARPICIL